MNLGFLSNSNDYEVITDDAILYKINGGGSTEGYGISGAGTAEYQKYIASQNGENSGNTSTNTSSSSKNTNTGTTTKNTSTTTTTTPTTNTTPSPTSTGAQQTGPTNIPNISGAGSKEYNDYVTKLNTEQKGLVLFTDPLEKTKNAEEYTFYLGGGVKAALILGVGMEAGIIVKYPSMKVYGYVTCSVGCGIQTPVATAKTPILTKKDFLSKSKSPSGSVTSNSNVIETGFSSTLTADVSVGVVGTYDLSKTSGNGLPDSYSYGSIGGGVWKNISFVFPIKD